MQTSLGSPYRWEDDIHKQVNFGSSCYRKIKLQPSCCLKGLTLFSDDLPTSCFEDKSFKTMLPVVAFSIYVMAFFGYFIKNFKLNYFVNLKIYVV